MTETDGPGVMLMLRRGTVADAHNAIAALEPARALDLHDDIACYLRGKAYFLLSDFQNAEKEWMHAAEFPGAVPFSPITPLLFVELGRARLKQGDKDGSRQAYAMALQKFHAAQPGFPVTRNIQHEMAALP